MNMLSNTMAENSTSTFQMFIMDGEDFILFLLLTTLTVSYLLLERKHFLIIWNKCKSSILECYKSKQMLPNQPNRLSLLEFTQWHYRGEGNEYLAISLPDERKILRLRKSSNPNGIFANLKDWYQHNIYEDINEESRASLFEKLNLEYYKVLVSLIGECFVKPSEDILLIHNEIHRINKLISSKRPEYRKKKRIAYARGSLLTDYAYLPTDWKISQFEGPTFAVEIKPKQGWIPNNERIYHLCTYCLNQYIKLQNGETSNISKYCPMDLFSGRPSRMKHAIKCLLNTPQNNLKIFQEGILVHGENMEQNLKNVFHHVFKKDFDKSVNDFCDLVTKALLQRLYTKTNEKCKHECENQVLPKGCVLQRILSLQQLDTWGASEMHASLQQQPVIYHENIYTHASSVVARAKMFTGHINCAKCFFSDNLDVNIDQVIQKYFMSAIAKDCSLMLTFRKIKNAMNDNIPQENILQSNGEMYAFQIGVFDLYPKPLTSIYKHARKRCKFIEIYKNMTDNTKYCNINS